MERIRLLPCLLLLAVSPLALTACSGSQPAPESPPPPEAVPPWEVTPAPPALTPPPPRSVPAPEDRIPIDPETERRLVKVFPDADEAAIVRTYLFEKLGPRYITSAKGILKVRFAILKNSGGTMPGFEEAWEEARHDWRDAIVSADFGSIPGGHHGWEP